MAFRLYRTTRRLYRQVTATLQVLHVPAAVGHNPTLFGLVALYVTGLVLLDARPSQTRISQVLPARQHDALNRLLRTVPLSTRALLAGTLHLVAGLSRTLRTRGYLVVDDVVIEKPFAKRLPWAAWTYSFAKKRKVYGCHVVLISWTSDPPGSWRIPVAFRLWRPKRKCRPKLGMRARALQVYAPGLGQVRLVVLRNAHGNYEYLVTNALATDLTTLVQRKRSRWRIETIFRDTKQLAGLAACQCWVDQALVRHVALVFLTFVVLQVLRRDPQETVGALKARWQGEVLRDGQAPPQPLRAAPPEFRRKRTA